MIYQIEGFNPNTKDWQLMPYQKEENGPEFTTFNNLWMAEKTLEHWREFCPDNEFRLVTFKVSSPEFKPLEGM